jgi:hypothetical protein
MPLSRTTTHRRATAFLVAVIFALALPAAAQAGFEPPVTVTPSGGDPFGYPSDVGFDASGGVTVQSVSGGTVFVYTRPAGASSFTGNTQGTGSRASLAVAANGAAVSIWRASATSVHVGYRASAGVGFNTSAASFTGSSLTTVAAGIDATGNAVVAWADADGIHYSLSSGASFGPAQDAPFGPGSSFEGRGSDPQRDYGPRAFRDNAGNVILAFRNGADPTLAHRATDGTWTSTVLPGGPSTDLHADADPTSQRLIVGYATAGTFRAFEGSTASTVGTIQLSQPSSESPILAVAVRRGGAEDLALWRDDTNALRSASCLEGFAPTTVAPSAGNGVMAAVTSGSDQLADYPGPGGLARSSRAPGGGWATDTYAVENFGTFAIGSGYNGEALGTIVDYPDDTAITGLPYSGAVAPAATCAGPNSPPADGRHPTATQLSCGYHPLTAIDTCTAIVRDTAPSGPSRPTGAVRLVASGGIAGNGVFASGSTCQLTGSGPPGSAACSVEYIPPTFGLTKLQAGYAGDASHAPSTTGAPPATPKACPKSKAKTVTCADPGGTPGVCKAPGPVYPQCYQPSVIPTACSTGVIGSTCQGAENYTAACGSIGTGLPQCAVKLSSVPAQFCGPIGSGLPACTGVNNPITICGASGTALPQCSFQTKVVGAVLDAGSGTGEVEETLSCPAPAAKAGGSPVGVASKPSGGGSCQISTSLNAYVAAQTSVLRPYTGDFAGIYRGLADSYYAACNCSSTFAQNPTELGTRNHDIAYNRTRALLGSTLTAVRFRAGLTTVREVDGWYDSLTMRSNEGKSYIGPREIWDPTFTYPSGSLVGLFARNLTGQLALAVDEGHEFFKGTGASAKQSGATAATSALRPSRRKKAQGALVTRNLRLRAGQSVTLRLHLAAAVGRRLLRSAGGKATVVPMRIASAYGRKGRPAVRFVDFPLRIRHRAPEQRKR